MRSELRQGTIRTADPATMTSEQEQLRSAGTLAAHAGTEYFFTSLGQADPSRLSSLGRRHWIDGTYRSTEVFLEIPRPGCCVTDRQTVNRRPSVAKADKRPAAFAAAAAAELPPR